MSNSGTLYIVATPIGNMGDITLRALETLKTVDLVLAEDTRVVHKLLERYEIKVAVDSYHHHSTGKKIKDVLEKLNQGMNIAVVTDAGTPGISDPGNLLVAEVVKYAPETRIVPIPGVSAVVAILSVSGFPADRFTFLGFPPHKNKREKYFEYVARLDHTVVFYESGHRIIKCLGELQKHLPGDRPVIIGKELTKQFETIYRSLAKDLDKLNVNEKGEFVVVINGNV